MSTEQKTPITDPPDKLSLILQSGEFEKVHYGLVMASAAAAIGRPVTMFFTMHACRVLLSATGWHDLSCQQANTTAVEIDQDYRQKGVATFDELMEACSALGVTFMVCEMGLRALGFEGTALRGDLDIETGGVVTFLNDASKNGAMLFI